MDVFGRRKKAKVNWKQDRVKGIQAKVKWFLIFEKGQKFCELIEKNGKNTESQGKSFELGKVDMGGYNQI